jgi:hypothetical protein
MDKMGNGYVLKDKKGLARRYQDGLFWVEVVFSGIFAG